MSIYMGMYTWKMIFQRFSRIPFCAKLFSKADFYGEMFVYVHIFAVILYLLTICLNLYNKYCKTNKNLRSIAEKLSFSSFFPFLDYKI